MRRLSLALLCVCTIFFLSACVTPTKTNTYTDGTIPFMDRYPSVAIIGYFGSIRKFEDVGIITTEGTLTVTTIDGILVDHLRKYEIKTKIPSQPGRYQVHLMPGRHVVQFKLFSDMNSLLGIPLLRSSEQSTRIIDLKEGDVMHITPYFPNNEYWGIKFSNGIAALPEMKKDFQKMKMVNY